MSISDNNKSLDKCIFRESRLCTQWLLSGHMSAQDVLCDHMSVQYELSGQFCWFPHPLITMLVDTRGELNLKFCHSSAISQGQFNDRAGVL